MTQPPFVADERNETNNGTTCCCSYLWPRLLPTFPQSAIIYHLPPEFIYGCAFSCIVFFYTWKPSVWLFFLVTPTLSPLFFLYFLLCYLFITALKVIYYRCFQMWIYKNSSKVEWIRIDWFANIFQFSHFTMLNIFRKPLRDSLWIESRSLLFKKQKKTNWIKTRTNQLIISLCQSSPSPEFPI